ncbi:hypothetical protein JZ751_023185 [Albula glossodonta]|uniref:Uncharacterized protein n=1 Tax=Albula glossodonta TaxID=121402 RepID=A0A8T2PHH1_9TELE|nr:hypothetical protein JZ751_023185 [Albula glossodonta]
MRLPPRLVSQLILSLALHLHAAPLPHLSSPCMPSHPAVCLPRVELLWLGALVSALQPLYSRGVRAPSSPCFSRPSRLFVTIVIEVAPLTNETAALASQERGQNSAATHKRNIYDVFKGPRSHLDQRLGPLKRRLRADLGFGEAVTGAHAVGEDLRGLCTHSRAGDKESRAVSAPRLTLRLSPHAGPHSNAVPQQKPRANPGAHCRPMTHRRAVFWAPCSSTAISSTQEAAGALVEPEFWLSIILIREGLLLGRGSRPSADAEEQYSDKP